MPAHGVPDPTEEPGARSSRRSVPERVDRQHRLARQPWDRFLGGVAIKLLVLFGVASLLFWLLGEVRGY